MFVLELHTWQVQRLKGTPPDSSVGQPIWAPSGESAVPKTQDLRNRSPSSQHLYHHLRALSLIETACSADSMPITVRCEAMQQCRAFAAAHDYCRMCGRQRGGVCGVAAPGPNSAQPAWPPGDRVLPQPALLLIQRLPAIARLHRPGKAAQQNTSIPQCCSKMHATIQDLSSCSAAIRSISHSEQRSKAKEKHRKAVDL